jgi:hypothetical protein
LRRNPWTFGGRGSHPPDRYSCQHSHFRYLQQASRLTFTGLRNAPLPYRRQRTDDRGQNLESLAQSLLWPDLIGPSMVTVMARLDRAIHPAIPQTCPQGPGGMDGPVKPGRDSLAVRIERERSRAPGIVPHPVFCHLFSACCTRGFGAWLEPRYIFGAGRLLDQ